jgi:hypothetical protein
VGQYGGAYATGGVEKRNGLKNNLIFMAKTVVQDMRIYPAKKYSKIGLWFRRKFLGHFVVTGKDLKSLIPKDRMDKRLIKNKVLYGVKIKTR